jgi:hypothetical protein
MTALRRWLLSNSHWHCAGQRMRWTVDMLDSGTLKMTNDECTVICHVYLLSSSVSVPVGQLPRRIPRDDCATSGGEIIQGTIGPRSSLFRPMSVRHYAITRFFGSTVTLPVARIKNMLAAWRGVNYTSEVCIYPQNG